MPDIRHSIQIDVPAAGLHPFVACGSGLSKWWAEDSTEHPDGIVDLGFFNRATVYTLQPVRTASPADVEWLCLTGEEWKDTRLLFHLNESSGKTLLGFTHANWEDESDYFRSCNTTWGALMFRLKAVAEGGTQKPLFLKNGWSL